MELSIGPGSRAYTRRRSRSRLPTVLLLTMVLLCVASVPDTVVADDAVPVAGVPPFYAVQRDAVAVPDGVMPWGPTWFPDGRHILFQDYNGGREWIADRDGSNVRCLTCSMPDHPGIIGGFAYVFPGDDRMFLANELGDRVQVLECAPSLLDCRSHQWLPVDLTADVTPGQTNLGRRTYHLAPDGVHLGYSITRPDGLVMIVGALVRGPSGYRLSEPRVINPPGPTDPTDTDPDGWANGGSLQELKSFADGGRSVIVLAAQPGGIPQQQKIDLRTGRVTRLTGYPDWNEDGALSPDNNSLLTASWRTQNRMTALGLMPLPRPFINLSQAIVAIYYVSSRPGFACDLSPWLLPARGDRNGRLVGQPLNPYGGGTDIPANNLSGQQVWSPDSTRVLLQGRSLIPPAADANSYVLQKGTAPSKLLIARISRPATEPVPTVTTAVGPWAPTPQAYRSSYDMPGKHVVNGHSSGTAVISIGGDITGGTFSVRYHDYSDDGVYFLNGTQSVTGSVTTAVAIDDDLTATDARGDKAGHLKATLRYRQILPTPRNGDPGVEKSGTVSSTWLGKHASGLPTVGACPDSMPRPSQLALTATARPAPGHLTVTARVTADIHGDERPVQGATVRIGAHTALTGPDGTATLTVPCGTTPDRRATAEVTATAGDTFLPASTTITPPAA
ncbi:hypothetical protein V1J52_11890 [Streptomyces sp. TRM 70351]|uniref:hypothetical protein n=1 Tax=Streptomyces sp. TRM 70351 TaxID=3116552 RepID=UPI002E7C145D|nr:hypothetical protein [Streptomyces sp. TRM 70351]MEE1928870.1 hypothetical protein [Streptomyces sp. TRM 70351]